MPMEVQIFGVKKSADTRKALRFFSERRIKAHFVNLQELPASRGELRRFAEKFGVQALVDRTSSRFVDLGLRYATFTEEGWLELLMAEPMVLSMPLVRMGTRLSIGLADEAWRSWL
jgi:arsenate reductase-like glutaredoxin family protein